MRRALLTAVLLAACVPARAARLERGPYLENMTSQMVTVRYRVDAATPAWLTFGAAPDCERFQTLGSSVKEGRIPLFGLTPDTTHCYRIYLPADQSTGVYKAFEGNFQTFRDEDKPYFSFLALGDSGSGSEEQLQVAEQMAKYSPDFVLHLGDIIESGLDTDADEEYFKPYAPLLSRVPFFLTLGNHDYGADYKTPAGKGFLRANFTPFHSVPLTGLSPHYYYFDIANARFIVLDANDFSGAKPAPVLKPDSKQYKWLEYVLSRTKKAWKFVAVHAPLYSTGSHAAVEEQVSALEPLFLKHNVDLVLQGHNHNYERTKPVKTGLPDEENGIIYLTLGGGGRPLYKQRATEDWSEKFLSEYHFANFTIDGTNLKLTVYDKDGQPVDTLEVQK